MAQLTQKKSLKKSNQTQHNKQNNLGKAPNDIYDLENEITYIHSENSQIDLEQKQNAQSLTTDSKEKQQDNYKLFSTSNLSQAKQSLQNGSKIKVKLPNNPSPHALIAMAHTLGFDTQPLYKLFSNSSITVKNILDSYVTKIKQQHSSLSNMNHPYQSSVFGYLFHCKQIDALQCHDDLSAKIRISMDLNYNNIVLNDDLFQNKFIYELSNKVFKCSPNNIRIQSVTAGSVIVVIGITLITLAMVGVVALSVKLHQRKQKQIQLSKSLINNNKKDNSRGCMNGNNKLIKISQQKQKDIQPKNSVNKQPDAIQLQKIKPVTTPQTFASSIFNKIKTGINTFNEQYSNTPDGSNHTIIDDMYARLIEMGFNDSLSQKAAKKYQTNINEAINWITEHENDTNINTENKEQCANNNSNKRENLILHINDPLWVNKKNYFWSATVIALSRDKVTIEYDNGGPYLWKKTETFALNDECLIQKQPGMIPEFEGCVEISKSNGGFITAWKSGLNRPMVDI